MKASFGKVVALVVILGIFCGLLVFGVLKYNTRNNTNDENNDTASDYFVAVSQQLFFEENHQNTN